MEQHTQIELIERVLTLLDKKTTHMDESDSRQPVSHYTSPARLEQEREAIFRGYPFAVAHSSQLSKAGDYITHDDSGLPILVVRGDSGEVKAFLNVCRHRGTKVVMEQCGCGKRAFVCPYHGWTYDRAGKLLHIPDGFGFPSVDCEQVGLVPLPVEECYGFVWVHPNREARLDIKSYLGGIARDLELFDFGSHVTYRPETSRRALNWKLVIDIFLEAYHLKYAHKNSIYPIFFDNVGIFDRFYPHLRNVFPKRKIKDLAGQDKKDWRLRLNANILYCIFPNMLLLIEPDHAAMVSIFPDGIDHTILKTVALIPEHPATEKAQNYWDKNVDILMNAVGEDLVMGESIQKGLTSGANSALNFGRFEQSLKYFHETVEHALERRLTTETQR